MRWRFSTLILLLAVVVPVAVTAETVEVLLRNAHYRPEVIHAAPGDTVLFKSVDDFEHSIGLLHQPELLEGVEILGGDSFSFTVPDSMASGTYLLGCDQHRNMLAKLVVSAP